MEVEQIDLKLLSEALGELARGFKKLKTVVDGLKISGVKVPIPEISGQNVPDPGQNVPEETETVSENWGLFVPAVVTSVEAKEYLVSEKFKWALPENIANQVYERLFGQRVRADKYKNQWVEDSENKKGWKKISMKEFENLHEWPELLLGDMSNIIEMNESDGYHCFVDAFGEVPEWKWKRRKNIHVAASEFFNNLKNFRKYAVGVHDSLPALR